MGFIKLPMVALPGIHNLAPQALLTWNINPEISIPYTAQQQMALYRLLPTEEVHGLKHIITVVPVELN